MHILNLLINQKMNHPFQDEGIKVVKILIQLYNGMIIVLLLMVTIREAYSWDTKIINIIKS